MSPAARFEVNQIVRGAVCGSFVILGFRRIGGVPHAQLKEVDPASGRARAGELALPLSALRPAE